MIYICFSSRRIWSLCLSVCCKFCPVVLNYLRICVSFKLKAKPLFGVWARFSPCNEQLRFYRFYLFSGDRWNIGNEGPACQWSHPNVSPSATWRFLWGKRRPEAWILIYIKEVWLTECCVSKYFSNEEIKKKKKMNLRLPVGVWVYYPRMKWHFSHSFWFQCSWGRT